MSTKAPYENDGSKSRETLARRVFGATANYGLGFVLPKVVSFLLIPVYTRFLTPSDFGLLELATTLGAIVAVTTRFGVPGGVTRLYFDQEENRRLGDYVTTVAWFLLVTGVVVGTAVTILGEPFFALWLPVLASWPILLLVAIPATMGAFWDFQRRLIQAREQSKLSAKLNSLSATVRLLLTVLLVVGFGWGAVGVLSAAAISASVFALVAFRYLAPDLSGRFRWHSLKRTLVYGIGILPSHLVGTIAPFLSRGLIAGVAGVSELGIFGVALRFTLPLNLATMALSAAYVPVYYSVREASTRKQQNEVAQTIRAIWVATGFGLVAVALGARPAIWLMTPAEYHDAADVLVILAAGSIGRILYVITSVEIIYRMKTFRVSILSVLSALASLAITALLAPVLGGLGLAIATASEAALSGIGAAVLSRRTRPTSVAYPTLARVIIASAAPITLGFVFARGITDALVAPFAGVPIYFAVLILLNEPWTRSQARGLLFLVRGRKPDR